MGKLSEVKLGFFDKRLQRRVIKRIESIDKIYWLGIDFDLNQWQFSPQLYDLIPRWWNVHNNIKKRYAFIHPIRELIGSKFPHKEILRYSNVYAREAMTNDEFEYWYNLSHVTGGQILTYYDRSFFMEKVEWWRDDVFETIKSALATLEPST